MSCGVRRGVNFAAAVDTSLAIEKLPPVSTLVQIESAVAELPPHDQRSLLTWLQSRLPAAPPPRPAMPEALKVFRQLQQEVKLTWAGATAWKDAVADARR